MTKEYLPSEGLVSLAEPTRRLIFGEESAAVKEGRICSVQSLSGTGALHLAADFLKLHVPHIQNVYISNPSWSNHAAIFGRMGFAVHEYPYWDKSSLNIDVEAMLKVLSEASRGSLVILHSCAHNPTGMDPSAEQWKQILNVFKERQLLPLLDTAYHGFASGSLEDDAASIRLFDAAKLPLIVTQSFAKNLGLYGERVGMLHIVCSDADESSRVLSQVKRSARATYSNPALHGALIVDKVLKTPELLEEWKAELASISQRIAMVRRRLVDELETRKTPGTWRHITKQIGMFSFTGLTAAQCERMTTKWHIYLLKNGRISLAGLNDNNVVYVAEAMDDCVRNVFSV